MSAAAVTRPYRMLRPVTVATLVAAAAGAALGIGLAPEGTESRPPNPGPRIGLTSGVARLPLPAGWQPLRRRSSLPGLEAATAVRGVHVGEVALDIRAPEAASLLPAAVAAAAAGGLPAPRLRRMGARTAWRYDLPGAAAGTRVIALALPTTGGVVTITCAARITAIGSAGGECERAMASVQLDGALALPPAPEAAARIVLPAAVARLNRQRRSGRRVLAARRSPQGRSTAALGLARSYATAADGLRPLASGSALQIDATLEALAREHRALANASRWRNARAARRAGVRIAGEEQRLAALLASVTAARTDR